MNIQRSLNQTAVDSLELIDEHLRKKYFNLIAKKILNSYIPLMDMDVEEFSEFQQDILKILEWKEEKES